MAGLNRDHLPQPGNHRNDESEKQRSRSMDGQTAGRVATRRPIREPSSIRASRSLPSTTATSATASRKRLNRRSRRRWETPPAPCNSFAPRRPNGTSTRRASAPPEARPALARRSGSPFTTTWPTPRATTRSPASQPVFTALPSMERRFRSIRGNCASGCQTTGTAPTPSVCRTFKA